MSCNLSNQCNLLIFLWCIFIFFSKLHEICWPLMGLLWFIQSQHNVCTLQHHGTHSVVWHSACCYIQLCKSTRILTDTMTSIVQHTELSHWVFTSLSNEASRCSDLSDIKKLRVVSTMGCGPGFSGAYWTFLITRRTEFLRTHTHSSACLNAHGSQTPLSRASHLWTHLLWIFSSIDLAQNALISKSTPQACRDTMSSWPCSRSS